MIPNLLSRTRQNYRKLAAAALLLAGVAALLSTASSSETIAPRAQPILLQTAAQTPDQTVGVIVQKQVRDDSVEQLVAKLGGQVTKDLRIINAFAAEMQADTVPHLARAAGVRWVSLDSPMVDSECVAPCLSAANLKNAYPRAVHAVKLWNGNRHLQGQGVTVAVVDSGINANHPDLITYNGTSRVVAAVKFGKPNLTTTDNFGHGTHVAGIIAGNGRASKGAYMGVAPRAKLVNVKVSDDRGFSTASDVVAGLQWILEHKDQYGIRVVNMSLNSSVSQSYHVDPLDAAVEVLWFNKIVVVVSAGNDGKNFMYPPANDPFVITVGAIDDRGTGSTLDDGRAKFSSHGKTIDGFHKPEVMAPGVNIVSLSAGWGAKLMKDHWDHILFSNPRYFRMSGTSMAAPVVSGVAALLLEANPTLSPDQVKYRIMHTQSTVGPTTDPEDLVDVYAAVHSTLIGSENTRTPASQLLWSGSEPINWDSVNWNSVNWNSVNWNSVNWNSVNWNSVNWNSDDWSP